MSRTRAVGIDLGTTYSAVAWVQDSGKTAMVPNSEGDILTPSLAFFDDKEVLVGKEAKKLGLLQPSRYADCVKRDMEIRFIRARFAASTCRPKSFRLGFSKSSRPTSIRPSGLTCAW
jgi:molecular chaperone DnaK (HSP70)